MRGYCNFFHQNPLKTEDRLYKSDTSSLVALKRRSRTATESCDLLCCGQLGKPWQEDEQEYQDLIEKQNLQ